MRIPIDNYAVGDRPLANVGGNHWTGSTMHPGGNGLTGPANGYNTSLNPRYNPSTLSSQSAGTRVMNTTIPPTTWNVVTPPTPGQYPGIVGPAGKTTWFQKGQLMFNGFIYGIMGPQGVIHLFPKGQPVWGGTPITSPSPAPNPNPPPSTDPGTINGVPISFLNGLLGTGGNSSGAQNIPNDAGLMAIQPQSAQTSSSGNVWVGLFVVAGIGGAIWYFFLRKKGEKQNV